MSLFFTPLLHRDRESNFNNGISTITTSIDSSLKERRKPGFQLENPFALKVGQVFIGVGRPLNLGATDAFSGAGRHVNSALRRFGAKRIKAGIGCGIGFGHPVQVLIKAGGSDI
ncbi:hypothetical protein MKW94_028680 [Papaver nudicaule]|uniref:Uncharacterized protein n=1 Tax=Papaver nudicaule TaxID=74823 RepID=A0AA41V137_PAPNU|nr:hypothetical protein [Papaver nudicaule]